MVKYQVCVWLVSPASFGSLPHYSSLTWSGTFSSLENHGVRLTQFPSVPYIPNIIYIYRKFLNSFNLGKIKIWQNTDGNNEIQGKGFEIMPMVLNRMGNINGASLLGMKITAHLANLPGWLTEACGKC